MLRLIKRIVGIQERELPRPVKRKPAHGRDASLDLRDDSLLPEVVEGNSVADWELWQDSVDCQMQELARQGRQSEQMGRDASDNADPFAGVKKHRGP